jgi:hypothetical protein
MMRLDSYIQTKDIYGLCYLGPSEEYLIQLDALRPYLEKQFPDIQLVLICRDKSLSRFSHLRNICGISDVQCQYQELKYDGMGKHPVEMMLKDCGIVSYPIEMAASLRTTRCVIITRGNHPTKPLTMPQIEKLTKMGRDEGYEVEVDANIATAGLVMGVESLELFQAALAGVETRLVPTGVGTRLYKTMFPQSEILDI